MVYCKLLSVDGDSVIYAIGSLVNDITGKIIINPKSGEYSLVSQPQKEKVYEHFIDKMLYNHRESLSKGIYPVKMAYEI